MSATKAKIKVLVADDHPVVRKGLQSCLGREGRVELVGEAGDGVEALRLSRELGPEVVLLDVNMPKLSGLEVTEKLRREAPGVKVLVLSMHNSKEMIFRIIQAGAHGYISKEASPQELMKAIEQVHAGEAFFSPEIARAALTELVRNGGKGQPLDKLTERERQVLAMIAEGRSNKEIAQKLNIGVRTVETHRERIMRRLDIHSVAGLTKFAVAHGMVSLDGSK